MNKDLPVRPANIANIVAINQGKRPHHIEDPVPTPLSLSGFQQHIAQDTLILDARTQDAFGGGHIPGSYNVQLNSSEFEQRVAWILPADVPIALVLERDSDAERALRALAFVGLEQRVRGHLAGGIDAWQHAEIPLTTVPQESVEAVASSLAAGQCRVLDVREREEWDAGHISGAVQCSFKQLEGTLAELPLDPAEPLAVVCAGGFRSSTACSILLRHGFEDLRNTTGGMDAWIAASLPTAS
ncbi:MAG: rhodanese-like domain-containing protein [Planctomycetota bacterium]